MAKRYELSGRCLGVVSELFVETHGRGRPCLSDHLMIDGVLWMLCSGMYWINPYGGMAKPYLFDRFSLHGG